METTFTGIRNLSYLKINHGNQKTKIPSEPLERYVLNMELTNDSAGKDLEEFKNILKKTGLKTYTHPINPNFLNIEIFTNSGHSDTGRIIFLNRVGIKLTNNVLSMMSFIGKLLKRVSNMKEEDFILDKKYLNNETIRKSTLMGEDILGIISKNLTDKQKIDIINGLHSSNAVAEGASKMSKIFTDEMINYLS